MDPFQIFLALKVLRKKGDGEAKPKKTLADIIAKAKGTTPSTTKEEVSDDDIVKGGEGIDVLAKPTGAMLASYGPLAGAGSPTVSAFHPTGLPMTLPTGTILKSPNGTQITLAAPYDTTASLSTLPPGGMVILPNGQYYKKPGGTTAAPTLPTLTQGGTSGSGSSTFLGGLGQGLGAAAPSIITAATTGIGQFFDWLTTPSTPSYTEEDYGDMLEMFEEYDQEQEYAEYLDLIGE